METAEELKEIINTALDNEYWIVPNVPKRCVLNQCYDLVNISGYVAEIYDTDNEKDLLFIADEPNEDYLHDGSAVFEVTWFKGRCFWVHKDDITIKPVGGFYI